MKDIQGFDLLVGDEVVRAVTRGRSAFLEFRTVDRIENGKLYLNGSKVPIVYPERLLILEDNG